jgi:hypothetical protein
MLEDDAHIQRAPLDEIRTMLTYCMHAERFGDDLWADTLEMGKVMALLKHVQVLRKQS